MEKTDLLDIFRAYGAECASVSRLECKVEKLDLRLDEALNRKMQLTVEIEELRSDFKRERETRSKYIHEISQLNVKLAKMRNFLSHFGLDAALSFWVDNGERSRIQETVRVMIQKAVRKKR